MKKLETLRKELANITTEELTNIVNCKDVDCETLTERQKLAVLCFREIAKSVNNSTRVLTLDCNYENSRFHNIDKKHPTADAFEYKVDFMSILSNDSKHDRLIAIYFKMTKDNVFYRLCVSGKKSVIAKFEESDLDFTIKSAHELDNVSYETVDKVIKDVCAILADDKKEEK